MHRRRENARRVQGVPGDDGHHDVELELAGVGGGEDGGVAPQYLIADLVDHLGH
jgi:hypothetical protein